MTERHPTSGPYIVTVRPYVDPDDMYTAESRRAVATLDESEIHLFLVEAGVRAPDIAAEKITRLPESGGSVSLRDGTVIEVEYVSPLTLASRCRASGAQILASLRADDGFADLVAAFNEAQS